MSMEPYFYEGYKEKRPFFSVIIPCFNTNSDNLDLLFRSILDQSVEKEDIEVIVSDDCSEDTSYYEIVEKYKDQLNLIHVQTDQDAVHCPGNNRENGVQYATGEWITFIDHDDIFASHIFEEVKKDIGETNEPYMVATDFCEVDPVDLYKVKNHFSATLNWMHGKFYNLDNFWKGFDLHFIKDLTSNEDVAICSMTQCIIYRMPKPCPLYIDKVGYLWRCFPDSESRKDRGEKSHLELNFKDYIEATGEIYIKDYIDNIDFVPIEYNKKDNLTIHFEYAVDSLLFMYFYLQSFKYRDNLGYSRENEMRILEYKAKLLSVFGKTEKDVINLVSEKKASWYNQVRQQAVEGVGGFIERETFYEFIMR